MIYCRCGNDLVSHGWMNGLV